MKKLHPPPTITPEVWAALDNVGRRDLVRQLRHIGYSYGEIGVVVPVPKSTVAMWCRDIQVTEEQRRAIAVRRGAESRAGTSVDTQHRRRREIERIREGAARYAEVHRDDPLFVAGVCLYWAEGSKTRNDLSITNSDPAVLRVFIQFVREHLDEHASFALALNLHSPPNEEGSRRYWRTALGLASTRFTKSFIKPAGTGHRKKRLPHGICRVRVDKGSDHWHRVMTWIEITADDLGG